MPEQETNLKRQMQSALTETVVAVRDRKRYIEEKWLATRRMWMGFPFQRYRPTDSSGEPYRVPAARRVLERAAVRCTKLLTPSVKWFEVAPSQSVNFSQDRLSNIDHFMWYVIRKKIKSRSNISQLTRCMILYGSAILKTSIQLQRGQVWPTQRVVDPFSFYVYPETASTIDEAEIVFEDFLFSYNRYMTFVKSGIVDDIPRSDLKAPEWPYHLTERLAYQGIADPGNNVDVAIERVKGQLSRTTAAFVSVTELWMRHEDNLYQVYIVWNVTGGPRIVGFFKSMYDDPMYRTTVHRGLPGERYTNSQGEDLIDLDSASSDMFNQFIDSVDYEQGFVAFGGSEGIRRDTLKMKGRAKWDFGHENPREVMQFIQPPVTSTNQLRAWQITNAMMQSLGGAGTIAEGQPGRNMPRSGQAVDSLINLSLADIQDIAESIEQEILTPGLSDIYKVANLIPDDQLMRIPGGSAVYGSGANSDIIRKSDVIGDYEFEWVGSLQFQDEAQRAQRMMIFLNMVPTLGPALEAQGYTFNLPELIQAVWRSGMGERGLNKVVVTLQEMQAIMQRTQMNMPMGNAANQPQQQQLMDLLASVTGQSSNTPPQRNSAQSTNTPPPAVSGLNPTLPNVTNGFVRR